MSGALKERPLSREKVLPKGSLTQGGLTDVSWANCRVGRPRPSGDREQTRSAGGAEKYGEVAMILKILSQFIGTLFLYDYSA